MHIKQLIEDEQLKVSSREEPETVLRSMVGSIEENGFDPQSESLLNASIITEGRRSSGVDGFRNRRAFRRLEIPVNETIYGGMSEAEVSEACEKEMQLSNQDRLMARTKHRRNALEAFIYDTRNKKGRVYLEALQETQEWLYDDGDDESEKVYMYRLEELKKLVEPIEIRFKDNETRPQATRDLLKRIVDYKLAAKSLVEPERDAVLNECSKAEQWLQEKTLLQDAMPRTVIQS